MSLGKKATKAKNSNERFAKNLIDDIATDDLNDTVHIGRVIKNMGFGKCRVFFCDKKACIVEASIKGKFGGGARRGVPIGVGTIVVVAENDFSGCKYQIISSLDHKHIHEIRKFMTIDSRVLNTTILDEETLLRRQAVVDDGFYFDTEDAEISVETLKKFESPEIKIDDI